MPELCRFYGISIRLNFRDHNPPHFHALYGEHEAVIEINSISVVEGRLPSRGRVEGPAIRNPSPCRGGGATTHRRTVALYRGTRARMEDSRPGVHLPGPLAG